MDFKRSTEILERVFLPTSYGEFEMVAFESGVKDFPHLALMTKGLDVTKPVLTRVHSECLTGDLFGSVRCDCGEQLDQSLAQIHREGGVLLYLRQEGRGIGLINKMKAYNLQDEGLDTIQANHALGFGTDDRDFNIALDMYRMLDVSKIRLLTNNPNKVTAFDGSGIDLIERVPLIIPAQKGNEGYLKVKKEQMGHMFGAIRVA
ncbi:MAG: GTP cyclohydrolase II [Flavobacteriales bacterium]